MNIHVGEWRKMSAKERFELICQQAANNYKLWIRRIEKSR
ncbi:hypothetical protein IQ10_02452 [Halalkalibacter nanhaiisediminis]|uniref:Uncharacterized protein n=1 Tax=Halalkalibacter nanhaiisediminis TaxID=688079 RepID=A0A562QI79_9BACI|nr:hypothetical protein IQ10_02452 [Halalkalibacter nanhaiisediminis]